MRWARTLAPLLALAACASAPPPVEDPCDGPGATWSDRVRWPKHLPRPEAEVTTVIVASVEDLAAADFRTRFVAARSLVAMDETAVPYLGHAEACGTATESPGVDLSHVLMPILRRLSPDRLEPWYDSPYAPLRAAAAATAAERRIQEHGPRLVGLLEDPDPSVRFAAIVALRTLFNRFHGFNATASAASNREAVARWRAEASAR